MEINKFCSLEDCDFKINSIYEGGFLGNFGDDSIAKTFPIGNQGGFRYTGYVDNLKYMVLYTIDEDKEWPDYLNKTNSIFIYYGDNNRPRTDLNDKKKGAI